MFISPKNKAVTLRNGDPVITKPKKKNVSLILKAVQKHASNECFKSIKRH